VIVKTLGEGYSGVVKLGQDINTQKMVALKILNKKLSNYNQVLKDLIKEASLL
jgi:serine/threonine protein kinase